MFGYCAVDHWQGLGHLPIRTIGYGRWDGIKIIESSDFRVSESKGLRAPGVGI